MTTPAKNSSNSVSETELAILHRVDERTQRIDERLDEVAKGVEDNTHDIDSLQDRVKRNSTMLNGISVGGAAILTWVVDKFARFFP